MGRLNQADPGRVLDDYTTLELHAIATRALADGDDYSRSLLREQLEAEEFRESAALGPPTRPLEPFLEQ